MTQEALTQPPTGAWQWTGHELPQTLRHLEERGIISIKVPPPSSPGKQPLINKIAEALKFPPEFGGNWDSLQDALTDLSWLGSKGFLLWLPHARLNADELETFTDILVETALRWQEQDVPCWILAPLSTLPHLPKA